MGVNAFNACIQEGEVAVLLEFKTRPLCVLYHWHTQNAMNISALADIEF